jgi:hypothetical protein
LVIPLPIENSEEPFFIAARFDAFWAYLVFIVGIIFRQIKCINLRGTYPVSIVKRVLVGMMFNVIAFNYVSSLHLKMLKNSTLAVAI